MSFFSSIGDKLFYCKKSAFSKIPDALLEKANFRNAFIFYDLQQYVEIKRLKMWTSRVFRNSFRLNSFAVIVFDPLSWKRESMSFKYACLGMATRGVSVFPLTAIQKLGWGEVKLIKMNRGRRLFFSLIGEVHCLLTCSI